MSFLDNEGNETNFVYVVHVKISIFPLIRLRLFSVYGFVSSLIPVGAKILV